MKKLSYSDYKLMALMVATDDDLKEFLELLCCDDTVSDKVYYDLRRVAIESLYC